MCLLEQLAKRVIVSLNLPYGLLKDEGHICYCYSCTTNERKVGFNDFNYPMNWYLFKVNVRVPPGTKLEEISNEWEMCFHGTRLHSLKSSLLLGLKIPGDTDLYGRPISVLEGHIKGIYGYDTNKIFASPSVMYAGSDSYSLPFCYKSRKSDCTYRVKTVLMLRIRPGHYVASGSTAETLFTTFFANGWRYPKHKIEWSTKERDSVVITGVLVRVERYQCPGHNIGFCIPF